MSVPAGLRETLSRRGVALILYVRGRDVPIYGDVATPLRSDGSFSFDVWGVGVRAFSIEDVRSAISPELGYREYREIRARQREAFERESRPRAVLPPTPRGGCDE